jgi:hypothetical protein
VRRRGTLWGRNFLHPYTRGHSEAAQAKGTANNAAAGAVLN